MDVFKPLSPVIPVFLLISTGFVFARWKTINLGSVTEIIVYLCAPCLVFTALATRPLDATDFTVFLLGAVGILMGTGALVWVYGLTSGFCSRGFTLPVLFMNAGNMGILLAFFAFGQPGLQGATLMFVIISVFQYSLGVYLLGGSSGWKEVFRLPLIYATFLGLAFNLGQIPMAPVVFEPVSMLGHPIPLMLVSLGYRLYDVRSLRLGHAVGGSFLRIIGGFVAAYFTVTALGAEGVNRQVILLYGALPSAVVNFVLTEKYGQDPALAASIVVLTTIASLVTIPLVFWVIL